MPELPEVEIVTTNLSLKLVNKSIVSTEVKFEKILKNSERDFFVSNLAPFYISSLHRVGKYIVFSDLVNQKWMTVHLGMTGAFFVVRNNSEVPARYQKHQHIFFTLDTGETLVYADIRKFGDVRIFNENPNVSYKPFMQLGSDPLTSLDPSTFIAKARSTTFSGKEIKPALLDSRLIAGVGNIYACEALFRTSIHPAELVSNLSDDKLSSLYKVIGELFSLSIKLGGSSVSDYVNSEGEKGEFQNLHQIYQKNVCSKCLRDTSRIIQNKRSTFYCQYCQPFI